MVKTYSIETLPAGYVQCPYYATVNGGCKRLLSKSNANRDADCPVRFGDGICCIPDISAILLDIPSTIYVGLGSSVKIPYIPSDLPS